MTKSQFIKARCFDILNLLPHGSINIIADRIGVHRNVIRRIFGLGYNDEHHDRALEVAMLIIKVHGQSPELVEEYEAAFGKEYPFVLSEQPVAA